jgi:uncharacterized protein (DUF58 family)
MRRRKSKSLTFIMDTRAPSSASGSSSRITSLLTNGQLERLARLRLGGSRRLTNRGRGEHLARKGGTSTEFCDYRDYVPGDDTRFVDWNIFSRLHRPYLKVFHQEEEMHALLLVDATDSMRFEGKLDRAKALAAAFGALALRNGERVSVCGLRGGAAIGERLPPSAGRANLGKLFAFLERFQPGGNAPLEIGIEEALKRHTGRGVAVVLSDFLTSGDMKRAFNRLHDAGMEIFALQILGPGEIDPTLQGDLRLVDSENGQTLDLTSSPDLIALYQEYRAAHERELSLLCQQRNGRFLSTNAAEPLDSLLFDAFPRSADHDLRCSRRRLAFRVADPADGFLLSEIAPSPAGNFFADPLAAGAQ